MKKTILLAMLTLATVSYGTMAVAQDAKKEARVSDAPPPPPPPPPLPSQSQERKIESKSDATARKASEINTVASDVLQKHATYVAAANKALKTPNSENETAAENAVKDLATSIEKLLRYAKSLENDVRSLLKEEKGALSHEQREIRREHKPQATKSQRELLEELKKKLAARAGEADEPASEKAK